MSGWEDTDVKPTNPKDAIGSDKLPLELVPDVIEAYASIAFLEGAAKYGRYNWRVAGVRASIYYAALKRHLKKWWNGEWADAKSGTPHLSSAIACIGIMLDAMANGKFEDDRPPRQDIDRVIQELEGLVPKIKAMFADKDPKQWTIQHEIEL